MKVTLTILGEPASKANSRELVTLPRWSPKHGKKIPMAASIKSKKALAYETNAIMQIPHSAKLMLEGPLRVTLRIFYATERPDLDESVILDVLQAKFAKVADGGGLVRAGVYRNDRQVREKHVFHYIDARNPRAEIEVEEIVDAPKLFDLPPPEPLARQHRPPTPQPMPEKPF